MKLHIPVMPLENVVIFPHALSPLLITGKERTEAMERIMDGDRLFGIFTSMPDGKTADKGIFATVDEQDATKLNVKTWKYNNREYAGIGTLVRAVKMLKFPDGTIRLLVRGISRLEMDNCHTDSNGRLTADVRRVECAVSTNVETVALIRNATRQFQEIISYSPNFPEELKISVLNLSDPCRVIDLIADTVNLSYSEKLAILTFMDFEERLNLLTILLNREVEVLRLGTEIQAQVHNEMSKSQKEFFLREQLRQIRAELGEGDRNPEIAGFTKRLETCKAPPAVIAVIKKEMNRLETIPPVAPEYNIACTYLDWLFSVPWNEYTEDRIDVPEAEKILDADHYGLQDIKERILEFLSVLQLKEEKKSPIICFIGPPGVGKTSLGKSIASAMGRKFVRISLGGVRDEAEIRGHRRTYIGSLPGRIIQGMKKAGSSNPVFMLDEIDKLANDHRGDPASALLEVLDPQQNNAFNDHYLEVDYDLSSVMFICTANMEDTIPGPLRDRMEIIRLPGYTAFEKHEIAKRYLIPRQMQENGLKENDIRFTRMAVDNVISQYTMEAGVRNLERTFGKLCRKIARQIVEKKVEAGSGIVITPEKVRELLGAPKHVEDPTDSIPKVGIATGLAWTSVGGVTLPVEAAKMDGKGDLRLTGSLGDVMKESALAAFSFVRGHAKEWKIDQKLFQKCDFHIHVPDGATPKDGPSAGVTLVTALFSLLTNRPVRPKLAMTGEITLSGKVTAIGGVREKVIAALRSGIHDVILPEENRKDLEDIPEEVRNLIRYHFVSSIPELLKITVPAKLPKLPAVDPLEPAKKDDEIYQFQLPKKAKTEDVKEAKQEAEETPAPEDLAELRDISDFLSGLDGKFNNQEELAELLKKQFPDKDITLATPDQDGIRPPQDMLPAERHMRSELEKLDRAAKRKAELQERMRKLNRKNKEKKQDQLELGNTVPPQTLSISIQTTLAPAKPEDKVETTPAAVPEKVPAEATPVKHSKKEYNRIRKPLFATPVKRKPVSGCTFLPGKKKRGK
ncbi:MAG: endopeptidase La [Lentisphaeria bacterium]|nr:endopeptidase La [Lentisphaeria bacterium]